MARLSRRTDFGGCDLGPFGSPQSPHRAQNRGRLDAQGAAADCSTGCERCPAGDKAAEVTPSSAVANPRTSSLESKVPGYYREHLATRRGPRLRPLTLRSP